MHLYLPSIAVLLNLTRPVAKELLCMQPSRLRLILRILMPLLLMPLLLMLLMPLLLMPLLLMPLLLMPLLLLYHLQL